MQNAALSGSVAVVATLLLATGFGLWRRRRDGRLRRQSTAGRLARAGFALPSGGLLVPAGDPGADPAGGDGSAPGAAGGLPVDPGLLAALGVRPGAPATLLQFSSAFCAPCRATRQILADVSGTLDGVRHVEVDAASQLPAVRALGIWRTPTVLVVDADGRIVQRAAGVPARAQLLAAVAPLLGRRPS
ncbi:TlpA family protein disulfide reductase [Plantactinospora mayteni]|uniref:TlpA family protein disulfide reductase n=1 Tax=Plantactinospora mayteni TaxID=566021 RepID=UPI001EF4E724|nr:thioredoxin family protein [Plantactinospora mayteni]